MRRAAKIPSSGGGCASPGERPPGTPRGPTAVLAAERGLLDLEQELRVALGRLHPVQEHLKCLLRLQRVEHPAELPDDLQLLRRQEDLLLTGA